MFLENKELDKTVPIPLYFQLKELIVNEIKSRKYDVDSLIPTEKELSDQFDISRTTVRQAITELVQEGWLYRIKSKGTFIARQKLPQDFLQRLETFGDQMKRLGVVPTTKVISFQVEPASSEVAQQLGIEEGSNVIYLFRHRFGDNEPVVTVATYLPYDKCAFLMDHDFEKESLYNCLSSHKDTTVYGARRTVEAVEATSEDARFLGIRKGSPIQLVHTVGFSDTDTPLEYSIARYRGDMSKFQITVYVNPDNK